MKLSLWIEKTGGVHAAAEVLNVSHAIVRNWRDGICLPRPVKMYEIVTKSKRKVTFEDMVHEYVEKQSSKRRRAVREILREHRKPKRKSS